MIYMKRLNGKHYMLATADEENLEDKVHDLMLIHTGAREASGRIVKEFKVRNLSASELEEERREQLDKILDSIPMIALVPEVELGISYIQW